MSSSATGDNLLTALISGSTAAAVTSTFTYPLDFIKTQQQLNNRSVMGKYKIPGNHPSTVAQIFRGSSALVAGNIIKNQARLISYNWATKFMSLENHHPAQPGSNGTVTTPLKTSAPRMVIAGAMSAFIETLFIVPFENIKITMIQNMSLTNEVARTKGVDVTGAVVTNRHHKPQTSVFSKQYVSPHAYFTTELLQQYRTGKPSMGTSKFSVSPGDSVRSASHLSATDKLIRKYNKNPSRTFFETVREIYALKGIAGFTAGTCITMTRQIAISTVWLSTYNATRQLLDPSSNQGTGIHEQSWFGHKHTAVQSAGLHLFASVAVVAATQPLDVVKSHIQSKNGKAVYRDSLSTAYRLFATQGVTKLWSGAAPRGIKIFVSGGLTAACYNYVEGLVNVAGGQRVFAAE
ncbi:hypothetical protein CAAN1_12S00584 [[Candida] anglica]|uniref:Mitochondrial thiamine pyrophosphate carrier 1 n=1 Tax=[Candida] anglica TaxID=148631 RepID=A0ABP0E8J2_9ASCO